jgi:hypothetical protein
VRLGGSFRPRAGKRVAGWITTSTQLDHPFVRLLGTCGLLEARPHVTRAPSALIEPLGAPRASRQNRTCGPTGRGCQDTGRERPAGLPGLYDPKCCNAYGPVQPTWGHSPSPMGSLPVCKKPLPEA